MGPSPTWEGELAEVAAGRAPSAGQSCVRGVVCPDVVALSAVLAAGVSTRLATANFSHAGLRALSEWFALAVPPEDAEGVAVLAAAAVAMLVVWSASVGLLFRDVMMARTASSVSSHPFCPLAVGVVGALCGAPPDDTIVVACRAGSCSPDA